MGKGQKMRKLYLIRHGQTLFNVRKKAQGWCESPLTLLGIQQAQQARAYFESQNIVFDGVYSSTSERCCDTTELLVDQPYTRLKGLKEWHFGLLEGEPEDLQQSRNPWSGTIENTHGDFFVRYGGEADIDVQNRMDQTIQEIISNNHQRTLCVSHAGAMWTFFLKRNSSEELSGERFGNCSILEYDIDSHNQLHFVKLIDVAKEV